ncbi:hypothetical protein EDC96DRAFT_582285, partial [Choanephora cucurbitarum]
MQDFQQQQAKESLLPRRQEDPNAFLDHPNDPEGIVPQFLKRFEDVNLNTTPGIYGIEMRKVVEAMKRFYRRTSRVADMDMEPEVRLAAQMISNGFLIQSKFHRTHQPQLVRSSNIVIFEAPESASSTLSWYAGEVVSYMVHRHHNSVYFLALVSVFDNSGIDRYGVPWVKRLDDHPIRKVMVCKAQDIITIAGLFTNEKPNGFCCICLKVLYPEEQRYRKFQPEFAFPCTNWKMEPIAKSDDQEKKMVCKDHAKSIESFKEFEYPGDLIEETAKMNYREKAALAPIKL